MSDLRSKIYPFLKQLDNEAVELELLNMTDLIDAQAKRIGKLEAEISKPQYLTEVLAFAEDK